MSDQQPSSEYAEVSEEAYPGEITDAKEQLATARQEIGQLRDALQAAVGRERMLAYELQHRVQNILAVLRSIYRRTLERGASEEEFAEHFQGRLGVIARYQSEIVGVGTRGIELGNMVREELLTVQSLEGPNCTITGPSVRLRHKWCELMGLAIHELTTNAIKFGALRHEGTLTVEWSLTAAPATLHFRWKEAGVRLMSPAPRPHGFGQDLIEEALPYELDAKTSFEFKPGGLECTITLPLPAFDDRLLFV